MTEDSQQTTTRPSVLNLFHQEVETHSAVLKDGLAALDRPPHAPEQLQPLIRSIHAIKGGALIVDMVPAIHLAGAIEECLTAVQRGEISIDEERRHILLQGVQILETFGQDSTAEDPQWLTKVEKESDDLAAAIKGFTSVQSSDEAPVETATCPSGVDTPPDEHQRYATPSAPPPPEDTGETPDVLKEPAAPPPEDHSPVTSDASMLDLFQTEVETHVAILNDGLLALENDPNAKDQLEALMRAAHSIKGGARIVGLEPAVRVAHAMEDCFVAAQKGDVSLGSDHIDILFRIVDILIQLSQSLSGGESDWVSRHKAEIDQLVNAISAIIEGDAIPVSPVEPSVEEDAASEPVQSPEPSEEYTGERLPDKKGTSDAALPDVKEEDRNRAVRVTAAKIERLMGQAGEVVVSARWLPKLSDGLLELKRNHADMLSVLDRLQEVLIKSDADAEAVSLVADAREKTKGCSRSLAEKLNQFDAFNSNTANLSDRLYHEVISVRMRPFADGIQGFPRLVRDLARDLNKKVTLTISGKSTEVDRDILEKLDAPLNHLIRNAIDHGIETPGERKASGKPEQGTLHLEAVHRSGMLMITFSDDGRGIDLEQLKAEVVEKGLTTAEMVEDMSDTELMDFLFLPGFSTAKKVSEISGRGVGLDVVHNMVHEVGGVVRAHSRPGKGLTFTMELPLTLSVVRTFLVEIGGEPFAFPLGRMERCLELSRPDVQLVEDRQYFRFDEDNIALVDIRHILEIENPSDHGDTLYVVVVSDRMNHYGLAVDKFLGEYDLVVRPLDYRLGKVPDISSVAVMQDGSPVLIFDVEDLVRSIDNTLSGQRLRKLTGGAAIEETAPEKRILVVDDSFTVREMERKVLESKGYRVETAVDGVDGWNAVRDGHYDMVVTDVDMPRMNGIELLKHIKSHAQLKSLPVVIVSYKDKEEDRLRGLEAGANYYLTKSSFEDDSLIHAAVDLIGEA
ncbi:MAG: response regulator [Deltaproteobacteria bacterium]|nr:response regulator [Deltaproteobacteria bacterium]